jgi:hypothetical protein
MDWTPKQNGTDDERKLQRWEKIMCLPADTALHDLSTGMRYRRGMFRPVYRKEFDQMVDTFQVIGTTETVHVPFLRLVGDGTRCSLMGKR